MLQWDGQKYLNIEVAIALFGPLLELLLSSPTFTDEVVLARLFFWRH